MSEDLGQPYQVYSELVNAGKNVQSSKKRIKWRFGWSNASDIHEVDLIHSLVSGKRTIRENGKEISSGSQSLMSSDFSHGWVSEFCPGHMYRIEASVPLSSEPIYNFVIDGVAFVDLVREPKKPSAETGKRPSSSSFNSSTTSGGSGGASSHRPSHTDTQKATTHRKSNNPSAATTVDPFANTNNDSFSSDPFAPSATEKSADPFGASNTADPFASSSGQTSRRASTSSVPSRSSSLVTPTKSFEPSSSSSSAGPKSSAAATLFDGFDDAAASATPSAAGKSTAEDLFSSPSNNSFFGDSGVDSFNDSARSAPRGSVKQEDFFSSPPATNSRTNSVIESSHDPFASSSTSTPSRHPSATTSSSSSADPFAPSTTPSHSATKLSHKSAGNAPTHVPDFFADEPLPPPPSQAASDDVFAAPAMKSGSAPNRRRMSAQEILLQDFSGLSLAPAPFAPSTQQVQFQASQDTTSVASAFEAESTTSESSSAASEPVDQVALATKKLVSLDLNAKTTLSVTERKSMHEKNLPLNSLMNANKTPDRRPSVMNAPPVDPFASANVISGRPHPGAAMYGAPMGNDSFSGAATSQFGAMGGVGQPIGSGMMGNVNFMAGGEGLRPVSYMAPVNSSNPSGFGLGQGVGLAPQGMPTSMGVGGNLGMNSMSGGVVAGMSSGSGTGSSSAMRRTSISAMGSSNSALDEATTRANLAKYSASAKKSSLDDLAWK